MNRGERYKLEKQFDNLMYQIIANSNTIKRELPEDDFRVICCFLLEITKTARIQSESH